MKCHSAQKKLSAYQDRELNPREQEEITGHLATCRDCRAQYEELELIRQRLEKWEEIQPNPWFYRQVVAKIRAPREQRFMPVGLRIFQFLRGPVLASLILIIGLTAGGYFGTVVTRSGLLPFQKNPISYAQQDPLFTTLKFFDPAPPGTFADGYLQMASYKEESR